jgi:murein DD-endopeptidase MepM/ murein hydrolase activator NlpD
MRKRLLYIVLGATLVVAVTTALTLPASADLTTVNVTLTDGTTVPVQVDVPTGTPIENIQVPTLPTTSTPTVPGVTSPTGGGGDSGGGTSGGGTSGGDTSGGSTQQGSTGQTSGEAPTSTQGGSQTGSGGSSKAPSLDVHLKPQSRKDKRSSRPDNRSPQLYKPDGSPSRSNPTFFDALPGPAQVSSVPNFVISQFHVPPFLLPIYQAAGIQFGIRWEILAAINEIETDYGRNLNVSSAGAVGWMQFLPSTWKTWGVDGNRDGRKDPYNPVDAIFSAARYLKAAGGDGDLRRAIFAYNHAGWYVDSVMLRARLIAGVPPDVIGSLTGLTQGRFPVYAHARYADDMSVAKSSKKVGTNRNAARLIESSAKRKGINIFARQGAPVVAVNDGVIKKLGTSKKHGKYVVLQDVYGNQYTYSQLGSLARVYPVPKNEPRSSKNEAKALSANSPQAGTSNLPKPTAPASAGLQRPSSRRSASSHAAVRKVKSSKDVKPSRQQPQAVSTKERLFAHPSRPASKAAGGLDQIFNSQATAEGYTTFRNYFSRALGLNAKNSKLRRLRKGAHVVGGTILGRMGKTDPSMAPHVFFQIRPTGKGAPMIDPKPILDGWKLLEATAIYRASGRNALYSRNGSDLSIGQVLLLPKPLLERRVLSDSRIDIYPGGQQDIRTGQIDRRVLATLAYLADSGLRPTVTALKSGHSFYTASGNVSEHSSGNAVDIAQINGIPIMGHQDPGGIAEQTVKQLMLLQGTMRPHQIISLMDFGGNTLALPDHADHIHVGFQPLFGTNAKAGREALSVLKPGQWNDLVTRLKKIDNPVVPTNPSKYAIPDKSRRGKRAQGDD